jgi:hypothetical protein
MAKKTAIKEKEIDPQEARNYKRMNIAAEQYGIKVATFKKLINDGKLTRFKMGGITLIDCNEFEKLIHRDIGNHGPERAPQAQAAK